MVQGMLMLERLKMSMMHLDFTLTKLSINKLLILLGKDINRKWKVLFTHIYMELITLDKKVRSQHTRVGNLMSLNLRPTLLFRYSLVLSDFQIKEIIGKPVLELNPIKKLILVKEESLKR